MKIPQGRLVHKYREKYSVHLDKDGDDDNLSVMTRSISVPYGTVIVHLTVSL